MPRSTAQDIVYHHYYDIGVAVGAEQGLVVPVMRNADRLTFAEIEQAIDAFVAKRARRTSWPRPSSRAARSPSPTAASTARCCRTPILNPPQSGILGMHAIHKRPVAATDQVVIRPMMYVALSATITASSTAARL